MTHREVERALLRARYDLAPCDLQTLAVLLKPLFSFGRTFGIQTETKDAAQVYGQALADLPPDLLKRSIDHAIKTWTWGNRLPLPGDLRKYVEEEFSERRVRVAKLEVVATKAPVESEGPAVRERTPEQIAAVSRMVSDCVGRLRMQEAERIETLRRKQSSVA